jgi:hypothetical protein
MDNVTVEEETAMVKQQLYEDRIRFEMSRFDTIRDIVTYAPLAQMRYGANLTDAAKIAHQLETARDEALSIRGALEDLEETEEKEAALMKYFIIHTFQGYKKAILSKYFLGDQDVLQRTHYVVLQQLASIVLLPAYALFMVYFIFVLNISIGSRSTNIWLLVCLLSFIQDTFLLEPTKIWVKWILINSSVSEEARTFCESLSQRSYLVLRRTSGLMRNCNAMVQHFNPACRAARMYPELPISRLLMSFGDHDFRSLPAQNIRTLPYLYLTTALLSVALLPELLQETALDIGTSSAIDFGGVLLAIIGSISVGLLVVVLFLLVLAVLYTFDVYPVVTSFVRRKYAAYKTDQRRIHVLREQFYEEDSTGGQSEGGFASLDKEVAVASPVLQVKPTQASPAESASSKSRRRASVFVAQTHSVKLRSGKERTVALRTTKFKPFQDITGMNRKFRIEQLPDADLIKQFEEAEDSDDSSSDSSSESSSPNPASLASSAVSGSVHKDAGSVASSNLLFRLVGFAKSVSVSAADRPAERGRESPPPAWETLDDVEDDDNASFGVSDKSEPSAIPPADPRVPGGAPIVGEPTIVSTREETPGTREIGAGFDSTVQLPQQVEVSASDKQSPSRPGTPTPTKSSKLGTYSGKSPLIAPPQRSGSYFVFQDGDDASVNTLITHNTAKSSPQQAQESSSPVRTFMPMASISSPPWMQATLTSPADRPGSTSPALSEMSLQSGLTEVTTNQGRRRPLHRGAWERVRHSGMHGSPAAMRIKQSQMQARAAVDEGIHHGGHHYSSQTTAGPGGAARVLLQSALPSLSPMGSASPMRAIPSPLRLSPMRVAYGESIPSRSAELPMFRLPDERPRGPGATGPGMYDPAGFSGADRYDGASLFM